MEQEFRLHPYSASTYAPEVDTLYFALIGISTFFTVLICILIVVFAVRYRHGARVNRKLRLGKSWQWGLEIFWSLVPFVIVMSTFAWGARLFFESRQAPASPLEVSVVGKQWMWKIQHEEGRREINELHVPQNQPVQLQMISEDVIHSFYIPAFRIKMDVLPGRYTSIWFEANRPGAYHLFCAEYCGMGHSRMIGRVIVQSPEDYAEWVTGGEEEPPEVAGRRVLETYRCNSCHQNDSVNRAPSLEGLLGSRVPLAGGGTVVADEAYIRESILNPQARVVAGYEPVMPTFAGQISEEEIFEIIAYLRSQSREQGAQNEQQ